MLFNLWNLILSLTKAFLVVPKMFVTCVLLLLLLLEYPDYVYIYVEILNCFQSIKLCVLFQGIEK